jgi:hypothetical protein
MIVRLVDIGGIVFSVRLRYTDSDCPFGVFKLFLPSLFKFSFHSKEVLSYITQSSDYKSRTILHFYLKNNSRHFFSIDASYKRQELLTFREHLGSPSVFSGVSSWSSF